MISKSKYSIPFFEFEIFRDFRGVLRHAVLTRKTKPENTRSIQKILNTKAKPIFFKNQLHGIETVAIKKGSTLASLDRGINCLGDIFMTNLKEIPLGIRIADCASILLFDPMKRVIANIHAGWKGLAKRIIRHAIKQMAEKFDSKPENIFAGISPMLGVCCSSFSNPEIELPKFLHNYIAEENHVNLWAIAESHLRECGVKQAHIENPRICTFCNPEHFNSFRHDKTDERFCTVIMLR